MRFRSFVSLSVAALLLALGTSWASASSPPPLEAHSCGDHITHSFRLMADMGPCTGSYGLFIDTDGVTVDLNDKTLQGGGVNEDAIGIQINASKVRITNGVVEQFTGGLASSTSLVGSTVDGLDVKANNQGIILGGAKVTHTNNVAENNEFDGVDIGHGFQVERNVAIGNGVGFYVVGNGSKPAGNTGAESTGIGIEVHGSANKLTSNSVTGNGTANVANMKEGIKVFSFADKNVLTNNLVASNKGAGIFTLVGSTNTSIKGNLASANGLLGISVSSGTATGSGNIASGNGNANECSPGFCV